VEEPNNVSVVSTAARQSPKLLVRVRILPGTPILSLCNVNLVDGLVWNEEAARSNRAMETNLMRV